MKTRPIYTTLTNLMILSMLLSACSWFGKPQTPLPQSYEQPDDNRYSQPEPQVYPAPDTQNSAPTEKDSGSAITGIGSEEPAEAEAPRTEDIYAAPVGGGGGDAIGGGALAPSTEGVYHPPSPTQSPFNVSPPAGTTFEDYGTNPFLDTEDDNLSTFALDVDTGSYTIARSYINDGMLPPPDAIRVEEFVNYFYMGYPIPSSREVFAIYADGAPSPFTETERYQMLRIGIQGYDVNAYERKPVSLTFVIDVSGSMETGSRLELVKDALELLVEQLDREDRVSIIAYTDSAWVVLPPTPGNKTSRIIKAIRSLYPMNSTNAEAGLSLGYQVALEAFMPGGVNRVILCSDGVANVGATGPDSIWESIKHYASEGITMTAIGVGMGNYNDVLLEQLADQGDGSYHYIDTIEEAERLFVHELVSTLQVIALDAKIQVDFNPEVVARYRLVGFENREIADEDFRNDRVDAAEIGAGHSVTALYEIKLHPGARGEIASIYLRWTDPDSGRTREIREKFYTDELTSDFFEADPYLQLAILVAEFAEILRESYWAGSTIDEVYEYTKRATRRLESQDVFELLDLMDQAAWLSY